jgi:hypothetical protein
MSSIKEMHYRFKQGLNKIDSVQNMNFRVPEIDIFLKNAQDIFILDRIRKLYNTIRGIDASSFIISEELKTIIKSYRATTINSEIIDNQVFYSLDLPFDYLAFIDGSAKVNNGTYETELRLLYISDAEERSGFKKTSFSWQELYFTFRNGKIHFLLDDNDSNNFEILNITIIYVKKPNVFHDAEDSSANVNVLGSDIKEYYSLYNRLPKGLNTSLNDIVDTNIYSVKGYKSVDGQILFGYIDIELPLITHEKIIDIAIRQAVITIVPKQNQE